MLFNANSGIFQLCHAENKLIFNEMTIRSAFSQDQHAELDFYSARSLKQQSADRHIAPLGTHYSDYKPTNLCSFSLMLYA
jgi:hypothetical protein